MFSKIVICSNKSFSCLPLFLAPPSKFGLFMYYIFLVCDIDFKSLVLLFFHISFSSSSVRCRQATAVGITRANNKASLWCSYTSPNDVLKFSAPAYLSCQNPNSLTGPFAVQVLLHIFTLFCDPHQKGVSVPKLVKSSSSWHFCGRLLWRYIAPESKMAPVSSTLIAKSRALLECPSLQQSPSSPTCKCCGLPQPQPELLNAQKTFHLYFSPLLKVARRKSKQLCRSWESFFIIAGPRVSLICYRCKWEITKAQGLQEKKWRQRTWHPPQLYHLQMTQHTVSQTFMLQLSWKRTIYFPGI